MTERLNTLEAKVRSCLYSPVGPKFPRVSGETHVELAGLERSAASSSLHGSGSAQKMRPYLPVALLLLCPSHVAAALSQPTSSRIMLRPQKHHAMCCHCVYLSLFACHTCPPSALLCFFKSNPVLLFYPFSGGWEALVHSLVETNIRGRPPQCGGLVFPFIQIVLISTYWDSDKLFQSSNKAAESAFPFDLWSFL